MAPIRVPPYYGQITVDITSIEFNGPVDSFISVAVFYRLAAISPNGTSQKQIEPLSLNNDIEPQAIFLASSLPRHAARADFIRIRIQIK